MNDGTIEAIIREMMPEYAKKILLCGNEEYSSLVMLWEENGVTGTNIIYMFDDEFETLNVFSVKDTDVRKWMKVLLKVREFAVSPNYHPTRVVTIEK